ncbi:beta-glucosidase [Glaciihabitans tibetensis]|uniref:Beta-glucosidase n=1 Tax=Glaciihabitans tibetensis TaxID=1266600 RepID=A0A2T0VF24_9MICO|nr:beta-glucosidase [Glaciihabitans tibetensis]PRY68800.1 beta-glucosidase [Glaciihabitans tibetensis]
MRAGIAVLTITALTIPASAAMAADWNDSRSAQRRAEELLDRMTLEEKIDMLHGEVSFDYGFYNAPIERLGIPALTMADGPAGVRVANQDVNEGGATAMPAPIALAAAWSGDLAEEFGRTAGNEAFTTGHNVFLSPAADIFRDPRAGRGFEAFGEDPMLSGVMASRQITGIQTNPVLADIKHLSAYNQEANRLVGGNAVVSERAYQEVFNRPIAKAVKDGHPASAMCAFNKINGIWACENPELLTTILREQMGFDGFVMSDYNATHTTLESWEAGLDQEQPSNFHYGQTLLDLVNDGTISEDEVDVRVLRILKPMFALGLFDQLVNTNGFNESAHAATSQRIAENSMVLLKNAGQLPLNVRGVGKIAVIGADADTDVAGGGSSLVKGTTSVSPLQGIRDRVGPSVDVEYSQGTDPIGNGASLLPGPEPVPSDVLTTAGGGSAGLTAQYWTNLTRDGEPGINRVEPFAALRMGFVALPAFNAQSPKLPETDSAYNGEASALWTSSLTAPVDGSYQFSLGAEGSARLYIDGTQVIEVSDAADFATNTWDVTMRAGETHDVRIEYEHDVPTGPDGGSQIKFGWVPPAEFVAEQARAAADLAAQSDAAVVVVRDLATEGADKPTLTLPQGQDDLIRAVARANPNTIVVLATGGPVQIDPWDQEVGAILQAWYGGQQQGAAIARILFGDVNPSGHLPVTFPQNEQQMPTSTVEQFPGVGVDTQYSEGIHVGYKGYANQDLQPKYPFGYGLSYTSFTSEALAVPRSVPVGQDGLLREGPLKVQARVTNTGQRTGAEVVQVYTGPLPGVADSPERALAGWAKVTVDPGGARNASIDLDPLSFAYWNADEDRFVTPRGTVQLYLGNSVTSAVPIGSMIVR